jgi:hypothetical protein
VQAMTAPKPKRALSQEGIERTGEDYRFGRRVQQRSLKVGSFSDRFPFATPMSNQVLWKTSSKSAFVFTTLFFENQLLCLEEKLVTALVNGNP